MKKLLIIFILPLFIFACDDDSSPRDAITWKINPEKKEHKLGDKNNFYARNTVYNTFYSLIAELRYVGEYCNVWVEIPGKRHVTPEEVNTIGKAYDEEIYPNLMECFGVKFDLEDGKTYDIMQIADFMGNNDGKLCILLLDIKDNYDEEKGGPYVAGFFDPINFWDSYPGVSTNKRDMIYIDTFPGNPGSKTSLEIVAHELQHLMNFVTRQVLSEINNSPSQMDLWINEGLSSAAEWSVFGHSEDRIKYYINDPYGTIAKGNNFFVWDQNRDHTVLDDYSTVYMFFQWLRLQNNKDIYKKIISSDYPDYRAVTENAADYETNNWEKLIGDWLRANYVNASSGVYGYRGEDAFNGLETHYIDTNNTTVSLLPGEGVFSYSSGTLDVPSPSGNIRYVGLTNALLTYNANPSNGRFIESGTITGQTPASIISPARSALGGSLPILAPYPISMEEMLRRNSN